MYYIKLNISGTSVDWEVSLQVGSAGPSHAIPPGWYVEDPRDGLLLGNLPINGDIYVLKCWLDLSLILRVILDFKGVFSKPSGDPIVAPILCF